MNNIGDLTYTSAKIIVYGIFFHILIDVGTESVNCGTEKKN